MGYYEEISEVIVNADYLLKNLLIKLSPIYKDDFGPKQDVTVPLFTTLHSTSESILILLLNQAIFDADVLLRTVMEGTIKYCYLMTGSLQERHEKYIEYKMKLTDIDRLLDHYKAVETVNTLKEFSTNSIKPFELSILSQEEYERLRKLYPAKIRNELKHKWSYQSLLQGLAHNHPEYEAQLGSLSTYSLASHFSHYDWTGVSSRQAQITDAPVEESEIFDIGHAVRIVANLLSFEIFRVSEYLRGNNYNSAEVAILSMKTIDFIVELIGKGNLIIDQGMESEC